MTPAEARDAFVVGARSALETFLGRAKDDFIRRFGEWVASAHREELEDVFVHAARARVEVLFAKTVEDAREWEETFETELLRLETIGLGDAIVGKAIARKFLKDELRMVLSYVPVVAGTVMKVGIGVALPGIGEVVGPAAGAGVEWLLSRFLGTAGHPAP